MGKNIINLNLNELKPGMVVAKEIQENKNVLVSKNIVITDTIITRLKNSYLIEQISIYEDDSLYQANNKKEIAEKELKKVEYKLNEICGNLYTIINNTTNLQIDDLKEIRELIMQLQEAVNDPKMVINDIVFYGSGVDSIYRHSVNVAALSNLIGRWLKFDDKKVKLLMYSALLHDLGKTKIDNNIFNKSSALTINDYKIVKAHSVLGYNIVKDMKFLDKSVSQGILMHHEREDGTGYPLGITGDKIPKFAKIIAIADVFDAINSNRSYRKKRYPFEAIQIIKEESFGKLDYNYCNVFLNKIINYYIGRDVMLNSEKIAKIVQMDINELERPLILLDNEFIDLKEYKHLKIEKFVL